MVFWTVVLILELRVDEEKAISSKSKHTDQNV